MLYKVTTLLALLDSVSGFSGLAAPAAPQTAAVARTSGVYATSSILRSETPTCECKNRKAPTPACHCNRDLKLELKSNLFMLFPGILLTRAT